MTFRYNISQFRLFIAFGHIFSKFSAKVVLPLKGLESYCVILSLKYVLSNQKTFDFQPFYFILYFRHPVLTVVHLTKNSLATLKYYYE
jgi:hypothetical protein